jgi:2,3-bisphosphoglycerate-dependent phosphoglycerate mutase
MALLILLRHGESMWNKKNLFTGWVDVPLSLQGIDEAMRAGREMQEMPIDVIFCGTLTRGIMTGMLVMAHHKSGKTPVVLHTEGKLKEWATIHSEKARDEIIPVICADALNERMYGDLQGLNKQETRDQFGAEQVKLWRRSYKTPPPNGESLEMTAARSIPYFQNTIVPYLAQGKNIFVSAHGNSLRSIIKFLDHLTDDEVVNLELATGVPVLYTYETGHFTKIKKYP